MQRVIQKKRFKNQKRREKNENVRFFKHQYFVQKYFKTIKPVEQQLCKKWLGEKSAFGLEFENSFLLIHKFDTDFIKTKPLQRDERYHVTFMHTPVENRRKGHMQYLIDYCMAHFNMSSFPFSEESRQLFEKCSWTVIKTDKAMPFVLYNKK